MNEQRFELLMNAISHGDLERFKELREEGGRIDYSYQNETKYTLLSWLGGALRSFKERKEQSIEILDFMLEDGADINTQDGRGDTILHILSFDINKKDVMYIGSLVMDLIEKGANINIKNNRRDSFMDIIQRDELKEKIENVIFNN